MQVEILVLRSDGKAQGLADPSFHTLEWPGGYQELHVQGRKGFDNIQLQPFGGFIQSLKNVESSHLLLVEVAEERKEFILCRPRLFSNVDGKSLLDDCSTVRMALNRLLDQGFENAADGDLVLITVAYVGVRDTDMAIRVSGQGLQLVNDNRAEKRSVNSLKVPKHYLRTQRLSSPLRLWDKSTRAR